MAKIWRVYEGREPTRGELWADVPLAEAISIFELRPSDFVSELEETPRFGNAGSDLWFAGFKHIVVEVEASEGHRAKWRPGFYLSRIKPRSAFGRLVRSAFVSVLGEENVLRVEDAPAVDSQGGDAVKITVVVAPSAIQKLGNGAALDALVRLRERLREMREQRTPIVEYATEAELAQDAGS